MSVQKDGKEYLYSYSGILKIVELILDIATLTAASTCPSDESTVFINAIAAYALLTTVMCLFLYAMSWNKKVLLPWHWIECLNNVTVVLIMMIASGIAMSELQKPFIVTGVIGFITAMAYVLNLIETWKLANTPRAQYVWTVPNMPL